MMRFGACTAAVLFFVPIASAQASYSPPRTADGNPDLGGVWVGAGDQLERLDGDAKVEVITVNGERRTYLIVDPPDGKLPFRDRKAAMAWREKYAGFLMGAPMPEFMLGPEALPNRDRCLMAANSAAPPMISQGDNDAHEIVQTPTHVLIAVEYMHEARIVPVFPTASEGRAAHKPPALQHWTGDSVGWWDSDTLVVETTSINARQGEQSPTPLSKDARVVERFTRVSDDELLYRAEVTDLAIYTGPWTIESSFRPTPRLWEYACHEGNYGMSGILSGARKVERDKARAKAK